MEMQKQKPPRKKNKIITKRKVLSATMSGTLLMTSVVIPTAYSLLSNQITAQAAALNIDLLQNITSSNNSGTNTTNRWTSNSGSHNVDFTISGHALANVSLLSGPRYAALAIPQELRGYVVANGNTSVTTNLTIDFNQIALINAIVSAGDTFVAGVATILSNNPAASINLTQVTTQLNLLKGIQNIGGGTFTSPTTLNGNSMLSAPLNDGIGAILSQNVTAILQNLRTAVNSLTATGLAAPAANTALALIKPPLITAIDAVLVPLVNGTGGILDLLLNASALGDTSITIPTKITAPTTIASNIDAKFVGSAVQTNLLDVNILSGADGISYVYLAGDVNLTLVAPTGNLSATTSAIGASDATATLPATLKNNAGTDIPVTSVITNSSGTTVNNGQLSAGTYTVTYSAAGYSSVIQTLVVTDPADTTAPDAPIVTSVTGNSTNGYTVTGTAEPNSTITIKNGAGATVGTATTQPNGSYSVNLPGSVGANAPLNVTAADAAGNVSNPTPTTTPADPINPVLVAPTGNLTATTSAIGATDATATLATTLKNSEGADVPVASVITNSSGATVTNGQLSAGTYTVTYSASSYEDVTQTLVVTDPADTTAPDVPTVGNVTGNSTNGYTVTGTAEPGSTVTIKDDSGAIVGTGTTNETGDYTVTLPGSVGPNAPISVTATDAAGNVSDPTPATTPADPTLVAPTGNLTATTSAIGASDAMASLPTTLKDSEGADVPVTAVITNASGSAVTNGKLAAGTYTVTYTAGGYDDVTQTLVVTDPADTTAPDAPTVGNVTGNSTNGYTVTGTAEPGSTVTIKDSGGATVGTGTANETGDYTVTLPGSVGPNAPISVTATDAAGNMSDPTPATTPADPTLVAPTGNLTATTTAVGAADGMATLPATLKDSEGADVPVTAVITNASGSAVTNGNLVAGTYTVTYTAGGYDDVTQTLVVTDPADTTAPDAPTVGNVTGNSTNGYTVTGTAEPGSTVTIKDGSGATVGTGTANETGDYTVALPGSVGPNAPISVTATDTAGNVSDPTPATTPADPTLVAPTGNLSATTSAVGASDAMATLPATLKDSEGADVPVTAVITNASGSAVTNGNLAAGTYTVTYTAGGYEDVTQTLVVTDPVDTTAPDAPTVGNVTGNSTNGYTVTGTAEPGSTVTIKDGSGATVGTGTANETGGYTVTLPGSVGPNAPISVTATDAAGNMSDPTPATTPADPVSPVLVAPTGNLSATTTAVGAADGMATLPATLKDSEGADVPVTAVITNASGSAVTNGNLVAGTYTVTYTAGGYEDVTQTLVVTDPADTTAPDAPTVGNVTGNSTNGYTVTGTAEPGSTVTIKDGSGATVGTGTANETGDYTVTLPGSVGPNAPISVTATDVAGNVSDPTPATTPADPVSPVLVAPTGNLSSTTSAIGAADGMATLPATLKDSEGADVPITAVITNTSGSAVTNGNLAAGTYTVTYTSGGYEDVTQTLVVTDPADTTAPDAPTVGDVTGNSTNGYTVTGTAEPGSTVTIKDGSGATVGTGTANETGDYTVTLPGSVGPNAPISVTATDVAGNVSDPTPAKTPADPDTIAPKAPTVKNVTGNSSKGYTVTGTAEPGSTVTIKDGSGATVGTGTANEAGAYTVTLPGSVGPNAPISVTATDAAGNVSAPTSAKTPADPKAPSDTTAPNPPSVDTVTGNTDTGYTVGGKGEPGSTITIKNPATGEVLGTTIVDKDGNYSIKLPTGVKPGTQLTATATDAAGNVSDPTDFIIPALTSGMAIGNSGDNMGGKYFSSGKLPATNGADTGWLGVIGTVILSLLGSLLFWHKNKKEDES
ncbi:phage tail tube protein [Lactococcus lactis]|nr:phage tail tube protein [Lactococcus lactis]QBC36530.1 LPXTG cell wall anchor domain-containing protein [Lactococcus lactis]